MEQQNLHTNSIDKTTVSGRLFLNIQKVIRVNKLAMCLAVLLFFVLNLNAQVPQKMSYQSILRNASGQLLANKTVGIKISILQGSTTGTVVYTETQTATTNANGLLSIQVGGQTGFNSIDWGAATYYIKTETDPAGGTAYTIAGTSQLLSVPYALYAADGQPASATTNGIVTTGAQTLAGAKTFNDNITLASGKAVSITGNSTYTASVQAPTTGMTASYTLTLPSAQATAAGQVLTNDGNGALSWTSAATSNIYTADGTLAADRTVTLGTHSLTFAGDKSVSIASTGDLAVNTNKFTVAAATGNTAVAGTLGVSGVTTLGGTLGVTGTTSLGGDATLASTKALKFTDANNTKTTSFVADAQTADIAYTLPSTLPSTGNTGFLKADANGALSWASVSTDNLYSADGTLAADRTVTLGTHSLTFAGDKSVSIASTGDIAVNTDKFTVAAATGNTAVAGTLGVSGATTLSDDMAVNGGDITTSATTASVFNTTATTVNIAGAATALNLGNSSSTTAIAGNATIGGTLGVTGATALGGDATLAAGKALKFTKGTNTTSFVAGTQTADIAYTLPTTLPTTGNIGFLKADENGILSWSSASAPNLYTADGTLGADRTVTLGTHSLTFAGDKSVSIASTGDIAVNTDKFTVAAATGNTAVGGTLGVTGDFAVNTSKFTVAALTGNTTVAGTLGVTGATSLGGDATMAAGKTLYLAGSTSGTIGLIGNGTVASYALTLPSAQGTANQVLSNDGTGVLSWKSNGGLRWYAENSTAPTTAPTATGAGSVAFGDGAQASATDMFVFGNSAGKGATSARQSNFLGYTAGKDATSAMNSNFIGLSAGYGATNANTSNFLGANAGYQATDASFSNFIGSSAGQDATSASTSNFIGNNTGNGATNASNSNFMGNNAGNAATDASYSNFLGFYAGNAATGATRSNFIGFNAGSGATNAHRSNFIGVFAGNSATNASYSTLIGWNTGNEDGTSIHMGSNNIVIGTNISLPNGSTNMLNLGGVLFGTGLYATEYGTPSIAAASGGKIGIGVIVPSATLHLAAGTTAAFTAPLKFTTGALLTAPEAGAMEYDGTHLYYTIGSTRYQLDQQAGSTLYNADGTLAADRTVTLGTHSLTFAGDKSVSIASTGDIAVNTDKLTVAAATGNTTVGGTLGVTGDFAVNISKFTVAALTGNTTVSGTLGVAGAASLGGDVTLAAGKTLTYAAGTGNFDQSASTGTFKTGTGAVSLNGATTLTAGNSLNFAGSTSGTVTIVPAAAAGTYTLTLPATVPTDGKVLQTDGSGNLSWATPLTLTNLSVSAPLAYDNTTGAFSITKATTSTPGYLSSENWNTFNSKVDATRSVLTGAGLTGGGDLSANRTLALDIHGLTGITASVDDGDELPIYDASTGTVTKITRGDLLDGLTGSLIYQGTWDASANTPVLADNTGVKGNYYVSTNSGSVMFGTGNTISFAAGDWVINNGTKWEKLINSVSVSSVFGRSGSIVATNGDYTAAQITNTPAGSLTSTTVQQAINELDTKKLTSTLSTGKIFIGNANVATEKDMIGDATIASDGTLTLASTAVTAASYGSATAIPTFTVDAKGRLTAAGTATPSPITLAANTTGTDIGFSASSVGLGGTMTLQVPNASGTVARGVITNTTQTIGGDKTFSGATTFTGNVSQTGTTSFSTGTGAVSINGVTTLAADKSLTYATGAGNFDQSASTGTFSTGTGAVSLNGTTTLAAGKSLIFSGSTTGTVGLKAPASITTPYTVTLPTAQATAGQVLKATSVSSNNVQLAWDNGGGISSVATSATLSNTDAANGGAISGTTLYLGLATSDYPGLMSIGEQVFRGTKTFFSNILVGNSLGGSVGIRDLDGNDRYYYLEAGSLATSQHLRFPSAAGTEGQVLVVGTNPGSDNVTQLKWGSAGTSITSVETASTNTDSKAGAVSGTTLSLNYADATHAGLVTTGGQTYAGNKTFTGNISQTGTTSFNTGTGAVSLNGATTMAANASFTYAAGAGNFDQSASTGTFSTGTGAVSLNGATTLAAGKSLNFTGSTSGTVTIVPAAAAGAYSLTLPTSAGSSGQVLSTDGTGVLSWIPASTTNIYSADGSLAGNRAVTLNGKTLTFSGSTYGLSLTAAGAVTATGSVRVGTPTVSHITEGAGTLAVSGGAEFSSDVWVNGTLNTPSDSRLKTKVETLSNVLAKIEQLRGVTYEFINQQKYAKGPQIGVIAQELQKQFPQLVTQGADGYLAVNYSQLTAVLLQAVKEQQQEIDTLKAQMSAVMKKLGMK